MTEVEHKETVLHYITSTGQKFAFDRGALIRLGPVGAIPNEGTVTTPEVLEGREPLFFSLPVSVRTQDGGSGHSTSRRILPEQGPDAIVFPQFKSDGSGGVEEPDAVTVPTVGESQPITNWIDGEKPASYSRVVMDPQDSSLCHLPARYILVLAGDCDLYEARASSRRPVVYYEDYFIMQLDLAGTEFLSERYLDYRVKYVTSCRIANRFLKGCMGTEGYFDRRYLNSEEETYKPYSEKFISAADTKRL